MPTKQEVTQKLIERRASAVELFRKRWPNSRIARELGVNVRTVKRWRAIIRQKGRGCLLSLKPPVKKKSIELAAEHVEQFRSAAEIALLINKLLAERGSLSLYTDRDSEYGDTSVRVVLGGSGTLRDLSRATLQEAILAAAGAEVVQICNGCKRNLPAGLFAKNRDFSNGLNPRCKVCERARGRVNKAKSKTLDREPPSLN